MARAVQPWTWRRALREHCPKHLLLTLYTVMTYMNRDGFAFPGQGLIARGTGTSTRTVQRHIAEAQALGWLATESAGRGGQGWRHNAYRAAVPDDLELNGLDEEIADALTAVHGEVEPIIPKSPVRPGSQSSRLPTPSKAGDTMVSSRSRQGDDTRMSPRLSTADDTIVSPRCAENLERDDTGRLNVTTRGLEGDDTGRQNVTTQLCRTNSGSETPALRTPAKEEAPTEVGRLCKHIGRRDAKQEPRQLSKEELLARIEAKAGKSIAELTAGIKPKSDVPHHAVADTTAAHQPIPSIEGNP